MNGKKLKKERKRWFREEFRAGWPIKGDGFVDPKSDVNLGGG
jgi:hypothetical protein